MDVPIWLRQAQQRLFGSRPAARRRVRQSPPMRRSVRPGLESLEDRLTPSTFMPTSLAQNSGGMKVQAMSAPAPTPALPPISQGQEVLSLFIDGAFLQLLNLQFEFIPAADAGVLDQPDKQSMVTADARANAAAAGVNYDTVLSLFGALGRLTGRTLDTAQADIHVNLPFAGALGQFVVLAGSQAARQAVQL